MAPYRFDAPSRAVLTASVACIGLLPLVLACQSDAGDDAVEDATPAGLEPGRGNAPPGGGRAPSGAASAPAGATADAAPRAAAQSTSPAAPASTPDESPGAPPAAGDLDPPAARALVFEACTYTEGSYGRNCDSIYVTMKQMSPPRCVQLTIDNCGDYSRQGLSVNVPMSWRLDSGTVSSNLNECELGVFYPRSSVALRASGSISWNDAARLPTEIVLDVTLEMSSSPDATSVDVATAEPINPVACAS